MEPFIALQYLMPKIALTRVVGALAGARGGRLSTQAIRWFIRRYGVDMGEAEQPDPAAYASFNEFFTRALHPRARPLASTPLLCPVDGAISQFGDIEGDRIFQAKGHHFSLRALLGGEAALAEPYAGGRFATLYLSPRDYHRIHMPCGGSLRCMLHVPGDLFSVNPATVQAVPGLFARNERVVCIFDATDARTPGASSWALVLVGATIVGSMATVWHGVVNPPRPGRIRRWDYAPGEVVLAQGAEMGRFLLGSTVVALWPRAREAETAAWRFPAGWAPGGSVRMGEPMWEPEGLHPEGAMP